MRTILFGSMIAAALSVTVASAPRAQTAPAEPLAMSYVQSNSAYWDIAVAWEKGFFAKEGFAPSYATNTGSVQSTQLLITQSVQMAISQPEVLIAAASRGKLDIAAFAAPMNTPDWVLVGQSSVKTIQELKGKVIGFSGLRVGEYWLTRDVLKQHGLKENEVDGIQIGTTPAKYAALQKGSVAAALLFQPTAAQALASGFTNLYDFSHTTGFAPLLYMVNKAWAADKQHGVRISRAIKAAHDWLNDSANRSEAISILAKVTKRDEKLLEQVYDQYFRQGAYSRDAAVDPQSLSNWIKLMSDRGDIKAETAPNVDDLILPADLGGIRK